MLNAALRGAQRLGAGLSHARSTSAGTDACLPVICRSFAGQAFQQDAYTSNMAQSRSGATLFDIPEPATVPFDRNDLNTVILSGVALFDPVPGKKGVVFLKIAQEHEGRFSSQVCHYSVEFWDKSASQIMKHIKRGDEVSIRGELREYMGRVSITAKQFVRLDKGTSNFDSEKILSEGDRHTQAQDRTAINKNLQYSTSKLQCLEMYNQDKTFQYISARRKIRHATVLGYLGVMAFNSYPVDLSRLCKDALLGPKGSDFVTIDEVAEALTTVKDAYGCGWEQVRESEVVKKLFDTPQTQIKVKAQEEIEELKGITYAQVYIVLALLKLKVKPETWNKYKTPDLPLPKESPF